MRTIKGSTPPKWSLTRKRRQRKKVIISTKEYRSSKQFKIQAMEMETNWNPVKQSLNRQLFLKNSSKENIMNHSMMVFIDSKIKTSRIQNQMVEIPQVSNQIPVALGLPPTSQQHWIAHRWSHWKNKVRIKTPQWTQVKTHSRASQSLRR